MLAKRTKNTCIPETDRLSEAAAILLRLSPTGWCHAIERLNATDRELAIIPAEDAIIMKASEMFDIAPLPNPVTLADHLKRQAMSKFDARNYGIAANIIEEIDPETGMFTGNLDELVLILERPREDLEDMLRKINHFRPLGCGAQSVHHTLRCQIAELPDSIAGQVARLLLTDFWATFSGGGREILSEISGLGHQAIEAGIDAIRTHLTPYPAERFWGREGEYLRRAFFHVVEEHGSRLIREPYQSDHYCALPKGKGKLESRLALATLAKRNNAFLGAAKALSLAEIDDPHSKLPLSTFARESRLTRWEAWLFTDGELVVDSTGERRYLREIVAADTDFDASLFNALDAELDEGIASVDSQLARKLSRRGEKCDEKKLAAVRAAYGIADCEQRMDASALRLLKYNYPLP